MKKTVPLTLFFFAVLSASGQIAVESFRLLETDLTANIQGTMEIDQNGEVAALIKVVTTQEGFTFDNGMLGIVRVVPKPGELWVYVPKGTQKLTITHPELGILRNYYFQIPIEGARTYELRLSSGQVTTIVKKRITATAELTIRVTPTDAVLFLDGALQRLEDGVFKKTVTVGLHGYRIEAVGYRSVTDTVEVKEGTNAPVVVELKSTLSQLTLTCADAEAALFLNGEAKGKSRWTGTVAPGKYVVEVSRPSHEPSIEEIEVGELEELTLSVAPPTPLYGSLRVESEPAGATVYVDGVRCGTTPCDVTDLARLLVGEHTVRVVKDTYDDYSTTVTLRQDEQTVLSGIRLTQSAVFTIDSHPGARLFIDDKEVGRTPYFDLFLVGEYHLRLECRKYEPFDETVQLSLSDLNPVFTLRQKGFPKSSSYVGAEVLAGSEFSAVGFVGAYLCGVNVEFRYRHPLQDVTQTAYFNPISSDGVAWQAFAIKIQPKSQFAGVVGYGIPLSRRFRLTPSAGVGYTLVTGVADMILSEQQRTYVLSALAGVKAELALSPYISLVASPEYGVPFRKSSFIETFKPVCPAMETWYGGLGLNIGIQLNL